MVATKTKPRKIPMHSGGGPVRQVVSDDPVKEAYDTRAKLLLREMIKAAHGDPPNYEKLQAGLKKLGVQLTPQALENKISRGSFSAGFLLQCMDALGAKRLDIG